MVKGDERYNEENYFWADSTLFEVLTFVFIAGDPETALEGPYGLVEEHRPDRHHGGDLPPHISAPEG